MINNTGANQNSRYKLWLEALLFAICLGLGLISCYLLFPNLDSDILWSIAIGKWIGLNHTVPLVDSFSWTIYGKEWLTHEWLFSYLAYCLSTQLGNWGFYLLAFIPVAVTIYVLYLMCGKLDIYHSYAFIIPMAVGISLLYKLALPFRAYIFGLMFFTILIYLLYFKRKSKTDGLYIVLLFVLWANFHVSVCMGILVLAAEMIRRIIIGRKIIIPSVFLISGITATLINPYGYKIWTYFLFTLTGMGESKNIAEWQAADFNSFQTLFLYLLLAATTVVLHFYNVKINQAKSVNLNAEMNQVEAARRNGFSKVYDVFAGLVSKVSDRACLLILFWAFYIYSLYSVRMFYYAIILWIIVISIFMGQLKNLNFTKRIYYLFSGLFLLWLAGNLAVCGLKAPDIINYDHKIAPVEEVQFLKENPNYQANLFNDYLYGGYLIVHEIPVFIDARSDSYIKFGIQQKYGNAVLFKDDPQKIFDEMQVMNIIIPNYSMLDRYLAVNQNWTLVYRGPSACIYTVTDKEK